MRAILVQLEKLTRLRLGVMTFCMMKIKRWSGGKGGGSSKQGGESSPPLIELSTIGKDLRGRSRKGGEGKMPLIVLGKTLGAGRKNAGVSRQVAERKR